MDENLNLVNQKKRQLGKMSPVTNPVSATIKKSGPTNINLQNSTGSVAALKRGNMLQYKNQRNSDSTSETKSSSVVTKLRSEASVVCGHSDSESIIEREQVNKNLIGSLGTVIEKISRKRDTSQALGSDNSNTQITKIKKARNINKLNNSASQTTKTVSRFQNVFCTVPKNLKEQELKFKESGYTVDPVFEYDNDVNTTKYLLGFKVDDDQQIFDVAIKILDAFISEYSSEECFRQLEGDIIS
jgi:hypothetical protein